jgi:hypothetical protein
MSLITEDNISQIENMSFSTSIDPKQIIEKTREILSNKSPSLPQKDVVEYSPHSPAYAPKDAHLFERNLDEPHSTDIPPPSPPSTPPYKPPSPDGPPPNIQQAEPLPTEEEPTLKVGGKVHYHGDIKPSRLWNIENIGSSFCTINTDDDYNLNTKDTIKVVRPDEIYLPNENYVYSMPIDIPLDQNQNPYPFDQQNPMMDLNANPNINPNPNAPNINFAPVIKIITDGNDMSSSLPPDQQPPLYEPQQQPQPQPITPLQTQENNPEIDFSIPIIKK